MPHALCLVELEQLQYKKSSDPRTSQEDEPQRGWVLDPSFILEKPRNVPHISQPPHGCTATIRFTKSQKMQARSQIIERTHQFARA